MNNKKGFSLIEILISVLVMAIISLGVADFTAQFFEAAHIHTQQIEKINFTRFSAERISDEVRKSEYIYPSNVALTLDGIDINTSEAIALLIPIDKEALEYRFTAFYFDNDKLVEFHSSSNYSWDENTAPSINLTSVSGSSQILASDIDSDSALLDYNLNYNNGTTDAILKGEIASILTSSSYALIKSIKWSMAINKGSSEEVLINGVSNNVPRFIE